MTFVARETEEPRRLIQRGGEALHFVELAANAIDQSSGGRSSGGPRSEALNFGRRQRHLKEARGWRAFGCVCSHGIT